MHWVIQRGFFTEPGGSRLLEAMRRLQIPHSLHDVVPLVGDVVPEPKLATSRVLCMGSYSMRHAVLRHGWRPGIFDLHGMDFQVQRRHWGEHLLNASAVVVPFGEVAFEGSAFIRPVHDSKVFTGKVFDAALFDAFRRQALASSAELRTSLTANTPVQVCEPQQLYAEYRYWVVGGRVVTRSLYRRGSGTVRSSLVDERFDDFVAARLKEWEPHEAFVIDVCETAERMRIVELNTINSAGFYGADLLALVAALEAQDEARGTE